MNHRKGQHLICIAFGLSLGLSSITASAQALYQVPGRFLRPEISTDEGGLWSMMDREETKLRRSPFVLKDKEFTQYVQGLTCKLAPEHCPDIRVHIVRNHYFNANMAPNGMMQVWSGLMLRADNEAQLASVLGHEIGHYLERHTLSNLRDIKSRAAFGQFLGLFGLIGALGQVGLLAGQFSFSREHESDADRIGIVLLHNAHYDTTEAAKIWENLREESKAGPLGDPAKNSPMFATHPPIHERKEKLEQYAALLNTQGSNNQQEWLERTAPFLHDWLVDEIKRGSYAESLVLFERLSGRQVKQAEYLWAKAEILRLRNQDKDADLALTQYQAAIAAGNEPAETHRGMGLIWRQKGNKDQAKLCFEQYLQSAPEAGDALMIKSYIEDLNT